MHHKSFRGFLRSLFTNQMSDFKFDGYVKTRDGAWFQRYDSRVTFYT